MPEPVPCPRHTQTETRVRCAECDTPICPVCMYTNGAGLLVCPDCAGVRRRDAVMASLPRGGVFELMREIPITFALMLICTVTFVIQVLQSGTIWGGTALESAVGVNGGLFGPAVDSGEWWRLLTHGFVHGSIIHFAFNMIILWWVGRMLEPVLGAGRYLGVFVVSVLAGGALGIMLDPTVLGVGASGGIFGLMACELVLQWRRTGSVTHSPVFGLFALNLVITFVFPGISIGGHIGGAIGGALCGALIALGMERRIDARIVTAALGALAVFTLALGAALA